MTWKRFEEEKPEENRWCWRKHCEKDPPMPCKRLQYPAMVFPDRWSGKSWMEICNPEDLWQYAEVPTD